ncbi:Acetokinase family-domain-containing protein [Roridomyces roridus]|uniref:Probable acetate kinase n=1 Tax=Roridomyces roridus TaxID=1738132 RepID=A0AAD7G1I2_9AGAR|nr:Acetokinase family-domain-containing protein [Roridomyces roridus]
MSLVLSVNAGSSSLKIALFRAFPENKDEPVKLLLTCSISNISTPPAEFSYKVQNGSTKQEELNDIHDHESGFSHFLDCLDAEEGVNREDITHVCHRVVHGGDYSDPVLINDEAYTHIERLSDLAPLHNGAALAVIKICLSKSKFHHAKSITFFDTAFHRSIPPHISSYAIDQKDAKSRGLKKYGFHGLSYSFILRSVADFLQKPASSLNLIVLHLGSGASACCIRQGQSLDTSMGLTPLHGLPGATRSGAIDPSLIFHYTNKAGRMSHDEGSAVHLHVTQAEHILNTEAGWKALAGTTDFGVITQKREEDPEGAGLAFDLFVDRVLNYVGSYHLKLGAQVDALVFSGGIGEHSEELRAVLAERIACLGYASISAERNAAVQGAEDIVLDVGVPEATGPRLLVCRTNEEVCSFIFLSTR